MPSPVAHSLAGCCFAAATRRAAPPSWPYAAWVALLAGLANAPDLDFLPGLLVGAPSAFHRQLGTHSLAAAAVCGLIAAVAWAVLRGRSHAPLFGVLCAGAYASHLLLDVFGADATGAVGLHLLWPFDETLVAAPVPLFLSIETQDAGFLASLLSGHNARAVLREAAVMGPLLLAVEAWNAYRRRSPGGNASSPRAS